MLLFLMMFIFDLVKIFRNVLCICLVCDGINVLCVMSVNLVKFLFMSRRFNFFRVRCCIESVSLVFLVFFLMIIIL